MLETIAASYRSLDSHPTLKAQAEASPTFQKLSERARRFEVSGRKFFLLEGDLLFDEVQLAEHALRKDAGADVALAELPTRDGPAKLLAISRNGRIVRWRPGMVLSYFVARESFPSVAEYNVARDSVRAAAEEWMANCGITFEYRAAIDGDPANRGDA